MKALTKTDFNFPGQKSVYHGKVRDVYNINGEKLVMVATDRISAFDVVLPEGIPYKGQMLNQIAAKFLDATTDICPNWKMATPDPMVTVGVLCEGFPVEMIVRGYLCGSAWRTYKSGVREICGVKLPDGMRENEKFPEPIVTPTTKAEMGLHDEDISKEEILKQGLAIIATAMTTIAQNRRVSSIWLPPVPAVITTMGKMNVGRFPIPAPIERQMDKIERSFSLFVMTEASEPYGTSSTVYSIP